jgi:DNA-binding response OmpR family regulator
MITAMTGRVLLLDDMTARRQLVCTRLAARGHTVVAMSPKRAPTALADEFEPDAVVVELKDEPPGSIIARLRTSRPTRVVFLVAGTSTSAARVEAMRAGADAVFVEPFVVEELVATLETMMSWRARRRTTHRVHDVVIDEGAHQVTRAGRDLTLTVTEFKLLLVMVRNVGLVMSKRTLLEQVWGFGDYDPNVVEVHVSALRRKLHVAGRASFIETVRGVGYVIRASARSIAQADDATHVRAG